MGRGGQGSVSDTRARRVGGACIDDRVRRAFLLSARSAEGWRRCHPQHGEGRAPRHDRPQRHPEKIKASRSSRNHQKVVKKAVGPGPGRHHEQRQLGGALLQLRRSVARPAVPHRLSAAGSDGVHPGAGAAARRVRGVGRVRACATHAKHAWHGADARELTNEPSHVHTQQRRQHRLVRLRAGLEGEPQPCAPPPRPPQPSTAPEPYGARQRRGRDAERRGAQGLGDAPPPHRHTWHTPQQLAVLWSELQVLTAFASTAW